MTTRAGRWAAATASVRGASHERDGKPNQDAVRVVQGLGPTPGLVAAVCDGHGGDRYVRSDIGSRLGTEVACDVGRRALDDLGPSPSPAAVEAHLAGPVAEAILEGWRERVLDDAGRRVFTDAERARAGVPLEGEPFVSYGCTLLLAIVAQSWIGILQIGDGDVTVVRDAQAEAPVPTDDRLVGGETTSLCLPTAVADARISVLTEPLPSALILTSDGYANSFASPTWRTDAGIDLRDHAVRLGLEEVEARLPGWLADSATAGGDDVSMALIARADLSAPLAAPARDRASLPPPAPTPPAARRGTVFAAVAVALLVGGGAGWALAGADDESPPVEDPTTTSPLDPAPSTTTTVGSASSVVTTTTTTPVTTTSTATTPAAPAAPATVVLSAKDEALVLVGETESVVLTFDPGNVQANTPRLFGWVRVTGQSQPPPSGWTFSDGALTFGDRCYAAIAIVQAGFRIWAVAPDRVTLAAYDPLSGDRLGRFRIQGGTDSGQSPIQDPCALAGAEPTPANSTIPSISSSTTVSTSRGGSAGGTTSTTTTGITGTTGIAATTTDAAQGDEGQGD